MTKKLTDETSDDISFMSAMDDVNRIAQDKVKGWKKRLPPIPLKHDLPKDKLPSYDAHYLSQVETGDELSYCRSGLQKRVFQDLRRGHFSIDMTVDLHGLTARMAHQELSAFFNHCYSANYKCLLIIHGKGFGSEGRQPILKRLVDTWLREQNEVLAFCSATSREGGTGASYVLLRNIKSR